MKADHEKKLKKVQNKNNLLLIEQLKTHDQSDEETVADLQIEIQYLTEQLKQEKLSKANYYQENEWLEELKKSAAEDIDKLQQKH